MCDVKMRQIDKDELDDLKEDMERYIEEEEVVKEDRLFTMYMRKGYTYFEILKAVEEMDRSIVYDGVYYSVKKVLGDEKMSELKRVGSGWKNVSKKGLDYVTLKVTLDKKDYKLLLFANTDKKKKIDYRVMLGEEEKKE